MLVEEANHRIEQRRGCLWVTVWRRPDLDTATGAALALALVNTVIGKISGDSGTISMRTVVLDLRQAPAVSGPSTQQSLGRLLTACELAGVTSVLLHGGEALAALQLGRLAREHAPRLGQVTTEIDVAERLTMPVQSGPGRPAPGSR